MNDLATKKKYWLSFTKRGNLVIFFSSFLIDGFINIACPAAQEEEEEETQFPDGGEGGRDHSRQLPLFLCAAKKRKKASAIASPHKGCKNKSALLPNALFPHKKNRMDFFSFSHFPTPPLFPNFVPPPELWDRQLGKSRLKVNICSLKNIFLSF